MGKIRRVLFPEPLRPYIFGGVAVVLFLSIFFLFETVDEETTSMAPTIPRGARLVVQKKFFAIERHNIVTLADPRYTDEGLVKRVIALPGDTFQLWKGIVYINDEPLDEPYLGPEFRGTELYAAIPILVPQNCYFVMGDNREVSRDSRTFGYVPRNLIDGKLRFIYWPPKSIGFLH